MDRVGKAVIALGVLVVIAGVIIWLFGDKHNGPRKFTADVSDVADTAVREVDLSLAHPARLVMHFPAH